MAVSKTENKNRTGNTQPEKVKYRELKGRGKKKKTEIKGEIKWLHTIQLRYVATVTP